jgi:hypothetical protein
MYLPTLTQSLISSRCFFIVVSALFITLCFQVNIHAQELRSMTINPDESPDSGVFLVPEYPEAAYLIISSNISNLSFSSNMNGIIEERNIPEEGVYRLIVQPFTQFITVTAPGFMQGRFRVAAPDAKESLFYTIETESAGSDLIPVNFIVEGPERANLLLDGQEIDYGGTVQLDPGPYELRIEQSGYRSIEDVITVSSENTLFRYEMTPLEEEAITIRSTPTEATIFVNGIQWGVTPYQDFFFPGEYLLRISKDGYREVETQIEVEEDGENFFAFQLEDFAGALQLSVDPVGAQVLIGGRDFTRQQDISLPPGTHRVVVEEDGFFPEEHIIEIAQGEQLSLDIELEPRVGDIRFATNMPDAQFSLFNRSGDTVQTWRGINLMREMPVGRYQYRGKLDGYRDLVGQLVVREDAVTRIDAEFDESMRSEADAAIAEQMRQRALEQQRRPENTRGSTPQRRSGSGSGSEPEGGFSAPRSFTAVGFSYTQLELETSSFAQNIQENIGGSLSLYNTNLRLWALNMHFGYSQLTLAESADSFEEDTIDVMSYSLVTGPKLGLGPFNVFALGGIEGNTLFFEGFDGESHTTADLVVEFGALFAPAALPFGFRYSMTMPVEQLEGDPIFTRQEIGIIFK